MSEPALWNKPSQKDKHCMIPLTRGVTASLNFAPYCQNMFQNAYTNYLLESKETKPVNSKGNQSWILIRRTDAESFQCFGHLMWRSDSLERILMQGKIEGMRKRGQRRRWLHGSPTRWTWVWTRSGSWWWTRKPGVLQSMGLQRVRHDWATELNWYQLSFHQLCMRVSVHECLGNW